MARAGDGVTEEASEPLAAGSVGAAFLEVAELHADRVALAGPSGDRTYAALAQRVRRAASGIAEAVPDPDAPVAVLAVHDVGLVEAMLAVVLSGHPLVVLDPGAPLDRRSAVLEHVGAALVVHDAAFGADAQQIAHSAGGLTSIDLERLDGRQAPSRRGPDDVLLLSCRTGPREVTSTETTHRGVLELAGVVARALDLGPDDRVPLLFPAWLPLWAVPAFVPLLVGARLVTLDVHTVGLVPVPDLLERERITAVHLPPSLVPFLAEASAGRDLPALRAVAIGGEPFDASVVAAAVEAFAPDRIAVGYGTEEGLVALEVTDAAAPATGPAAVGRPVHGVVVRVLADDDAEAPAGEVGEVAIGDPSRRTGDRGRLDRDGRLVLVGRSDRRLRLRGRWLDLAEVERVLGQFEGVGACAVEGTGAARHIEVGALVATDDPERLDVRGIRARLLEVFEPEAVPSRWQLVRRLPEREDGSVDRSAVRRSLGLADPAASAAETELAVERGAVGDGVRAPWSSIRDSLARRRRAAAPAGRGRPARPWRREG